MNEFLYPTDIDLLYSSIDENNIKLQHKYMDTITGLNPRKGTNYMVNEIGYDLSVDSQGNLIVNDNPGNEDISQFQEVMIKVKLDNASFYEKSYTGFVVILHISEPSMDDPQTIEDFNYHLHLIPNLYAKGTFYIRLSDIFNRYLKIGLLNKCKFRFQVLAKLGNKWDSFVPEMTKEIGLYKTNNEFSSNPDDLSNAFMAINDINFIIDNI